MIKLNKEALDLWELNIGKVVEIAWLDHFSTAPNEPFTLDDIIHLDTICERVSVGYLLKVTKDVMILAATKEQDGSYADITVLLAPVILGAYTLTH